MRGGAVGCHMGAQFIQHRQAQALIIALMGLRQSRKPLGQRPLSVFRRIVFCHDGNPFSPVCGPLFLSPSYSMNCGQITALSYHQRAQRLTLAVIFIGQFLQLIDPIERFARAHAVRVERGQRIAQGIAVAGGRQS